MPIKPQTLCSDCSELAQHEGKCLFHWQAYQERKKQQRKNKESNKWYYRKSWKTIRLNYLQQNPFCEECLKEGNHVQAIEVDHVHPHQGNPELFYDQNNLQSLCKSCHSRKTIIELFATKPRTY